MNLTKISEVVVSGQDLGRQSARTSHSQSPDTATKTIMIAAPGRLFRDGIRRLLQRPDRAIVESCETVAELGAALELSPPPDLFVVGIGDSPPAEVFAEIRAMRSRAPGSCWIALSRRHDLDFLREAIDAGLEGLLLEDSPGEVLQLSTELVLLGHSFVPTDVARMMSVGAPLAQIGETWVIPRDRPASCPAISDRETVQERSVADDPSLRRQISLSERENEILHCLVAGYPNKLIARELQIAEATVKVHVKGLLRKMQVANRTQAAISALKLLNAAGDSVKSPGSGKTAFALAAATGLGSQAVG